MLIFFLLAWMRIAMEKNSMGATFLTPSSQNGLLSLESLASAQKIRKVLCISSLKSSSRSSDSWSQVSRVWRDGRVLKWGHLEIL